MTKIENMQGPFENGLIKFTNRDDDNEWAVYHHKDRQFILSTSSYGGPYTPDFKLGIPNSYARYWEITYCLEYITEEELKLLQLQAL